LRESRGYNEERIEGKKEKSFLVPWWFDQPRRDRKNEEPLLASLMTVKILTALNLC
jgi:hypothetical protein